MALLVPDVRDRIQTTLQHQRQFFSTGKTRNVDFRIAQLKALKQAIREHQPIILDALHADLHKPPVEAYSTEIGILREVDYAIHHIRAWVQPKRVKTPATFFPGRAHLYPEPLGVVLIMGAWNYPVNLIVAPLIGAIAAGNCALLKPSEIAAHTSHVIADLMTNTFDPAYIAVIEGGIEVSQAILAEKFDHIFFTGGTAVGKVVMTAAAQYLTPVTLELGGKSPCIVDTGIDLNTTARRIVWGKFLNAGQTCIAPDYLLVQRQIKPALMEALQATLRDFYGPDPAQSQDYARIVNTRQFERLIQLVHDGRIVAGGETHPGDRYIAPTILDQVSPDAPVMQEEIFGPILPVLEYGELGEAIAFINARPKPLALYLFSNNKSLQNQVLQETTSGGVCFNDTILHTGVSTLPFGGVGDSGMGSYHGKASFDTLSHQKSVFLNPFWFDLKWRYAPYDGKLDLVKKVLG